jgi:phosphatidylserine/phosphatidylglycerophosphate/cardiolipin synthase-like enzyme
MSRTIYLLILLLLLASCGWPERILVPPAPPPAPAGPVASPEPGPLELWQDAAIFTPVRALIDGAGAGQPLWVEMYEFGRADLAAALLRARARGADVRLIVDRTVPVSGSTADRLLAAGLPVRAYPVDDRRHQIDHVKLVLGTATSLVGGMNWGATSARNHDYAYETGLPDVLDRLRAIFLQDWSLSGGRAAPLAPAAGPVAQTTPGHEIRDRLTQAIESASGSIDAEVFVLTDPEVLAALGSAERRGVRVRVLLDPGQDVNRSGFDLLTSAGIAVRWYPVPPGAKLHAKAALFDGGRLLVGSANWSQSGLSVNHELDLVFDQPEPAGAFASRFEVDWSSSG